MTPRSHRGFCYTLSWCSPHFANSFIGLPLCTAVCVVPNQLCLSSPYSIGIKLLYRLDFTFLAQGRSDS